MKDKHLWFALVDSVLFVMLIWRHYDLWWLRAVQALAYTIVGIKALDHFRAFYQNRKIIREK